MKVLCGTDIIEVFRVQDAINTLGVRFLEKIYTQKEIEYCESKKAMKYEHYAARFAAKEAIFKAISTLIEEDNKIEWKNIEIENKQSGKPVVNFVNINLSQIENIDLSISHIKEYATANCTVLCK